MLLSFHEQIRNFLLTGEGAEEFSQLLLRMIFSNNGRSPDFRRILIGYYGSLSRSRLEEDVIPDLIEILLKKRDMFLSKDKLDITFCIIALRNAILDRLLKKNREDKYSGELPMYGKGKDAEDVEVPDENAMGETEFVQQLAAEELVHTWVASLSDAELRIFCDYLYREHGDLNDSGFLDDISEEARYKQVSRLKKRLRVLNEQNPDYKMLRDREIWHRAFSLYQSEICPGLRLYGVKEIGSANHDKT